MHIISEAVSNCYFPACIILDPACFPEIISIFWTGSKYESVVWKKIEYNHILTPDTCND